MILTDREIKIALARGALVIDPLPDERAFASTSVDLTLIRPSANTESLSGGWISQSIQALRSSITMRCWSR